MAARAADQPAGRRIILVAGMQVHFGTSPHGRKAARKEQAREALATYGLPVDTAPEEALLDELRRTAGHVAWLSLRVQDLDVDELASPYLALYQQERRHPRGGRDDMPNRLMLYRQ